MSTRPQLSPVPSVAFLSDVPLAPQRVAVFSGNKSSCGAGWPLLFTGGGGDHSKLALLNLRILDWPRLS